MPPKGKQTKRDQSAYMLQNLIGLENNKLEREKFEREKQLYPQALQLKKTEAAADIVKGASGLVPIIKPLLFGFIIILLIAGPGIMGISNVVFNTPIWVWIGAIFLIVLFVKLGIFGKR